MRVDPIFPCERPSVPGLDYYEDWRLARGASGDYLDYFDTAGGYLELAIGDVAGKGLSGALRTSLHDLVRAMRLEEGFGPADLMPTIDKAFYRTCPDNCYATLFLARYDPYSGQLVYVNAGHEPPVILRWTGNRWRVIALEANGPVIGMLRKSSYREGAVSLQPGDLLVAYTDGLCEARNAAGQEWGYRSLLDTIQSSSQRRAHDIVDCVMAAVENFAAGAAQFDDMTLWVGRINQIARKRGGAMWAVPLILSAAA
jgi:sigma-B regulation protein RsbU (phosphoserine phosphatase)